MPFSGSTEYTGAISNGDTINFHLLNSLATQYASSTARPTTANLGVLFVASDTLRISVDSGTTWNDLINTPDNITESLMFG